MTRSCANPACTGTGTKTCVRCRQSTYCSQLCQKQDWPRHKGLCKPAPAANANDTKNHPIPCVTLYGQTCGGSRYSATHLPSSHPIFQTSPLPISLRIGYPLVMARLHHNLPPGIETDNQHATWLHIDPVSGFAPPAWQAGIGTVHVARPDGSPLTVETLAGITDYVSDILDASGEGVARRYYDRKRLEGFLQRHGKMQREYRAAVREMQAQG